MGNKIRSLIYLTLIGHWPLIFILLDQPHGVSSAKILVSIMFGTKSHRGAFEPLFRALGDAGHSLTIVSPFPHPDPHPRILEIQGPILKHVQSSVPSPFLLKLENKELLIFEMGESFSKVCDMYWELPEIQEKVMGPEVTWDLILMNGFANECSYGLISKFPNTSLIILSSVPPHSWTSEIFGAPAAISTIPIRSVSRSMTFPERVINFMEHAKLYISRNYNFVPKMETSYQKYIPGSGSVRDLEKRASIVLLNSHPSLTFPRPMLPDMIEVGGMHCREAKPLPKDLEDFVENSPGFIYFSMGSFALGTGLPEKTRLTFVKVFAQLAPIRVIWKFETEDMPDTPPNVLLRKWLPQQDILGHPKAKLFIGHGGLLSTIETVYHHVPLLGIPLFGDQEGNAGVASNEGFGLTLELKDLNEEILLDHINTILNQSRFQTRARELSIILKDQLETPLNRAIYWTQYVLKHNGAHHLRSPGRDLNFVQYHSLDVIGTLILGLVLSIYLTLVGAWIIFKYVRSILIFLRLTLSYTEGIIVSGGSSTRGGVAFTFS